MSIYNKSIKNVVVVLSMPAKSLEDAVDWAEQIMRAAKKHDLLTGEVTAQVLPIFPSSQMIGVLDHLTPEQKESLFQFAADLNKF